MTLRWKHLLCWCAVAQLFCGIGRLHATMVVPRTLDELVSRAEYIIVGKVATATAGVQTDPLLSATVPVTKYTLIVSEVLKGPAKVGEAFAFEQLGGGAGTMRPVGVSTYEQGQEYLLFLKKLPSGLWTTVGLEQGKWTVQTVDGKKVVENGHGNRWVFGGTGSTKQVVTTKGLTKGESELLDHRGGPVPYDDMRSLIKKLSP